jgi:hypothetical protein
MRKNDGEAMAGADFGVSANDRRFLAKNFQDMIELLKVTVKAKEP